MNKLAEFSFRTRKTSLHLASQKTWDLVVIGGGITGAAVARDAQLRGIDCLLVEAKDFASGTSSGSSKLIHGGLRYLQNREFSLVYHAIRERELLQKLYAPFVRPIDFVFPTYQGRYPPRWLLNIGLSLYDSFSFFSQKHRNLNKKQSLQEFPFLNDQQLTGSLIYADSFTEDYRLVIELIKSFVAHEGSALSYCPVQKVNASDGQFELELFDSLEQKNYQVKAQYVINCAGPFSDEIRRLVSLPPILHLTQGVHFVLPKHKLPIEKAFVLSDPEKNRILFAIPWNNSTYLGTTDTNIGAVRDAQAQKEDLEYVLDISRRYFKLPLSADDIIQSWAAVRPLIDSGEEDNSKVSREHEIQENPKNFFHILGGKLTSHRLMAEEALEPIMKRMNRENICPTRHQWLQGQSWPSASPDVLEKTHLEKTFGWHSKAIREIDEKKKLNGRKILEGFPHLEAEIYFCLEHEMLLRPLDYIRRRSSLYYEAPQEEVVEKVCQVIATEQNWSSPQHDQILQTAMDELFADRDGFRGKQRETA